MALASAGPDRWSSGTASSPMREIKPDHTRRPDPSERPPALDALDAYRGQPQQIELLSVRSAWPMKSEQDCESDDGHGRKADDATDRCRDPERAHRKGQHKGASAEATRRAAIIVPEACHSRRCKERQGECAETILNRPLPMPKITAKIMAPGTSGAVRMRIAALTGSERRRSERDAGSQPPAKPMLSRRLATCEGPNRLPTTAALAPSPPGQQGTMCTSTAEPARYCRAKPSVMITNAARRRSAAGCRPPAVARVTRSACGCVMRLVPAMHAVEAYQKVQRGEYQVDLSQERTACNPDVSGQNRVEAKPAISVRAVMLRWAAFG